MLESLITSLIKVILYIIAGWIIFASFKKITKRFIGELIKKKYKEKEEREAREKTLHRIIYSVVKIVLIVVIGLTSLSEFGVDIAPLLAGAGLVGLAISFASRSIVEDYLSGFFLLIEDQFRIGDIIYIGPPVGLEGKVIAFDLRKVTIKDKDGAIIIIRSGMIKFLINKTKKSL